MNPAKVVSVILALLWLAPLAPAALAQQDTPSMATLWRDGDPGERLELRGQVLDGAGQPVAGATVFVRQANGAGVYAESYQAQLTTDRDGAYALRTALPGNYGGVRHIHMTVIHDSAGRADTRVLFKDDAGLPGALLDQAIVLDETSLGGERLWIGTFDVVLGKR